MKSRNIAATLAMGLLFLGAGPALAADFHVKTAQELQTALSTAQGNGADDTIYLAAGTYAGRFSHVANEAKALTMKLEPGVNPGQVVLDGENLGRVLYLYGNGKNAAFTVEGLTVTKGANANGAGMYAETADGMITVSKCTVTNISITSGSYNGIGIYLSSQNNVVLTQNVISNITNNGNNYTPGVGIYVNQANKLSMTGNLIRNNSAGVYGQATVYLYGNITTIELTENEIADNTARWGGAVYVSSGSNKIQNISFIRNTISRNKAQYDSYGAICIDYAADTVTFTDNIITENITPQYYGGLFISKARSIVLRGNTISRNRAGTGSTGSRYHTAAFYNGYADSITFEKNIIADNITDYLAGVYINGYSFASSNNPTNSIIFRDNVITRNQAINYYYGGVYIGSGKAITFTNNLIAGNKAGNGGSGGLYLGNSGTINFINNTVTGNSATTQSGGIEFGASNGQILNFFNNIVWGNTAPTGGDIYLWGSSGTLTSKNNTYHSLEGLWSTTENDKDVAPLFIDEAASDYHLQAGSSCLNTGDNTVTGLPAQDLEGNDRIADGTVDLGAYEHSATVLHPADMNADWVIDSTEFTNYGAAWRNGQAWTKAPATIPIDFTTRAGFLLQKGGTYKNIGGGKPLCWSPVE